MPVDRYFALTKGTNLAHCTIGAALFADISGFTPLTETLLQELGPHRGSEELSFHLNRVYEDLITHVHLFGGSSSWYGLPGYRLKWTK